MKHGYFSLSLLLSFAFSHLCENEEAIEPSFKRLPRLCTDVRYAGKRTRDVCDTPSWRIRSFAPIAEKLFREIEGELISRALRARIRWKLYQKCIRVCTSVSTLHRN